MSLGLHAVQRADAWRFIDNDDVGANKYLVREFYEQWNAGANRRRLIPSGCDEPSAGPDAEVGPRVVIAGL